MGKKNKHHKGGGGGHTAKYLLKLGASLIGGAVLGEVISPLTGPVSGPAIGMAVVGLPVWGMRRGYLANALVPAIAVQALKTASSSKPIIVAKASLSGATQALKSAEGNDDLARARAAVRGR